MTQTINQQAASRALKGKILAAYAYLTEHNDDENAEKVRQLAGKLRDGEFAVAFCGHFSAGKSTMINRLIGEKLLPSSPIPTSANLVKVKAGDEYAKVWFKNGKPRLYLAPYDYAMVKNYCKDGDQIQSIEISHSGSKLPPRTVILDTPGIDSVDAAHRTATESAIHLADLVFYVMDYNHVQSELNFLFTKELADAGKEVYLVVNQVDKHNEQELPFDAFKDGAIEAFAAWGVKPADVFYTSLKDAGHPYDEFLRLQSFLARKLEARDSLLQQSIARSLRKILNDHLSAVEDAQEEQLRPHREILAEITPDAQAELEETYGNLLAKSREIREGGEAAERAFDLEVDQIMDNAYLMPFQTRALAKAFLEACQPNFKVGWLPGKKKTLAERAARRDALYRDVCEKAKSQLTWHLRDFLLRFAEARQAADTALYAKVQDFSLHVPSEILEKAVKEGARMSGEYVLNYTDSVTNEIKRLTKAALAGLKKEILRAAEMRNEATRTKLEISAAGMEKFVDALDEIRKVEAARATRRAELERALADADAAAYGGLDLFDAEEENAEIICGQSSDAALALELEEMPSRQPAETGDGTRQTAPPDRMKRTADKLARTADLVKALPGFEKLADALMEKSARLTHRGFTVALFGAFSAGKSSFANALIGERVLPVSPNPMTAAISKIKPADAANRHGTVRVKLKEEEALLADVRQALRAFALEADNLDGALAQAESLRQVERHAPGKAQYAFLRAFARGYAAFRGQLGTLRETTFDAFGDYVAREEKSCFVEWIDLYYDCPLTRKGVTLVDTPGADSINARHTGVAFEYIKNADAIIFVTYFNHAFSKADRDFLMQLGRVKDAFQLDKMFFVINAVDLAENEAEQALVAAYVEARLVEYGVKNPQLYPLSSLRAIEEKRRESADGISGMARFEERFYHFITHDLGDLASAAAQAELKRVRRLVGNLIDSAREDSADRGRKRARLEAEKSAVTALLKGWNARALHDRLTQETEELVFYIRQRVFLRFGEFFREAFNPNVLQGDGRSLKKALRGALHELVEGIGFILAEEMRATTVRLDRFAEKRIAEFQAGHGKAVGEINADLSFSAYEGRANTTIAFAPAFEDIRYALFDEALASFKNAKAFFEKKESKRMSEAIERVLHAEAEAYLRQERARLQAIYGDVLETEAGGVIEQMERQAEDFYLSLLSALEGGVPLERLLAARQALDEME